MKLAVTVWENRISPLFDATRTLLIAEIHNRVVTKKHLVSFDCISPFSRAETLEELGIDTLICGGVSDFFSDLIEARDIRIIPFVAGCVDEVIDAYLKDALCHKKFKMPGCGDRQYEKIPGGIKMKIAVSSSANNLDSPIDPRFGRCAFFIVVDTETMNFEAFDNESIALGGGAGIQAAQFVASKGAKAIMTGNVGPNAVRTLAAAGVEVFVGQNGTVRNAIDRFKRGELQSTSTANVVDHYGMGAGAGSMGGGGGMGGGMGGGKGRGMGRGMGGGMRAAIPSSAGPASGADDVNQLKNQVEQLKEQIKALESKLSN